MFTIIANTGERLQLNAPKGLKNISYGIDIFVPMTYCQGSNNVVTSWTARVAYESAVAGLGYPIDTSSAMFYPETLTFTAAPFWTSSNDPLGSNANFTVAGSIYYYAMRASHSLDPDFYAFTPHFSNDIWIAIANPPSAVIDDYIPNAPYFASFFTCSVRNASITANVVFADNIQSLQDIEVRKLDPYPFGETDYSLKNYNAFQYVLFKQLSGNILRVSREYDGRVAESWQFNTTIGQTVLGSATDMSIVSAIGRWNNILDTNTVNKPIATLIKELSLNVSLSLMSILELRSVRFLALRLFLT